MSSINSDIIGYKFLVEYNDSIEEYSTLKEACDAADRIVGKPFCSEKLSCAMKGSYDNNVYYLLEDEKTGCVIKKVPDLKEDILRIYTSDYGWAGCDIVIATSRKEALDIILSKGNGYFNDNSSYEERMYSLESHPVSAGFIYISYGDQ